MDEYISELEDHGKHMLGDVRRASVLSQL